MSEPLRQPIDEHDQNPGQHGQAPRLEKYFQAMIRAEASDLHLKAGSPPHVRIHSILRPTRAEPLTGEEIDSLAMELLTPKQRTFFEEHGSIDVAHELEGSDRFRLNIYRQRGHTSISARWVTLEIPTFERCTCRRSWPRSPRSTTAWSSLPAHRQRKVHDPRGHAGPRQRDRTCHIVTIEDPIEHSAGTRRP